MASEIRVNTINNSSGLGTITISDTGHVFSGITTIGSVTINGGTVTATSYAGDGSALTGIAATDNVRTGILDVAGVGTFRSDVNVPDSIIHLGDTDTKIRFPTDDTVSFETGGSERFRVGSAGQFGIGGATYGDSGQVLTSGGASAAPSWAAADSGAEWTDATRQNTNGANEYLFTGLPTNVKELVVNFDNVSWTTGSQLQFQLGTSGGLVGGSAYLHGYAYLSQGSTVSNGRTGSNAFVMGVWTSASHGINGTIRFTNIYDNNWSVEGILHTILDNTLNAISGMVDLGGTLDRIAIQNRGGNNFDGGAVNIHYITT